MKPHGTRDRAERSEDAPGTGSPPLYSAGLADPRERAAAPREMPRGRAPRRAEVNSDVTRFRGIVAATVAAAAAAGVAALLWPPPGGHGSPGPLSRPHARAKLACSACHIEPSSAAVAGPGTARSPSRPQSPFWVPDRACTGCHKDHPSTRPGHVRARAAGQMHCSTCHPIHRSDQGVAFVPNEPAVRFAPGVEVDLAALGSALRAPATVAIASAGSCAACHDVASPRDPIARCLVPGQEALGPLRPIVCFDEHQPALAADLVAKGEAGVCTAQHTEDRTVVWELARDVAIAMPVLPALTASLQPWAWIGAGLLAGVLVFAGVRAGHAWSAARRKRAQALVPDQLVKPAARVRLPRIDVTTCLGCYACVDACPYDVLDIERYVAVLARPEACCGLTLCEQRCPNGSLKITDGDTIGDRPCLDDSLQSPDMKGLYLAGDITGLPLIKNAILQGAHAVTHIEADLRQSGGRDSGDPPLDLLIIGAGPAGISAALRAKELGLRFEVMEQGSVAQSIRSFPRGKLVFDQPLELPVTGKLWLKESTKEELLTHWMRVVRQEKLPIRQDTRMTGLVRSPDGFTVTTEPREGGPCTLHHARRVLLAIGQRGTPRRLPFELSPDVESSVHYHLADAKSFAGKKVLIAGLGDVAMETAIALGRQPGTTVTIAYRGLGFSRGKSRNIEEVRRMSEAGRLSLRFQAEITSIEPGRAVLTTPSGPLQLPCDAAFVMIGNIPPLSILRAAGVRTIAEQAPPAPIATASPQIL